MKVLLDTNVFLWAAGIERSLPKKARDIFSDPDIPIYLSTASSWEIAIKWSKGKLDLPHRPFKFVESVSRAAGIIKLDIDTEDSCAVADLPWNDHKDPFDRLLVAQAREHNMKLMTADAELKQYAVELILL